MPMTDKPTDRPPPEWCVKAAIEAAMQAAEMEQAVQELLAAARALHAISGCYFVRADDTGVFRWMISDPEAYDDKRKRLESAIAKVEALDK